MSAGAIECPCRSAGADNVVLAGIDELLNVRLFLGRREPRPVLSIQVPVAKDQINVLFGMALVTGCTVPVTADLC